MPLRSSGQTRIHKMIKALRVLSDQTVVHRRKFEFILNQLHKFDMWYVEQFGEELLSKEELERVRKIMNILVDLKDLFALYILQTWAVHTVENPPNHVFEQIKTVTGELREIINDFSQEIAQNFDKDSVELISYHIYDLRAIIASFAAFAQTESADSEMLDQIQKRMGDFTSALALLDTFSDQQEKIFSPIPLNYQQWKVDINDFEIEEEIGSGASAIVYKGTCKKTGEKVALKRFKFANLSGSKLQLFQREVAVLAVLNKTEHPCLIKFIGATDTPPYTIVTEFMPNKSLFWDCRKYHKMSPTQVTIAAYDIARGMQYLHSCQIVHRDLKSLNILLDENYKIRICDFGFAKLMDDDDTFKAHNAGTMQWMAPEILKSSTHFTSKVDVYAYGILLTEILTGRRPYGNIEDKKALSKRIIEEDLRPSLLPTTPPLLKDLITQCWDKNPDVRPTFDEIVARFDNLEILFPGCDVNQFKNYVIANRTAAERLMVEWNTALKSIKNNQMTLDNLIDQFEGRKMPPEIINSMWDTIFDPEIKHEEKSVIKMMKFFAGTSKMGEASTYLRNLKPNSIPEDVLVPYLEEIPTGSMETDSIIIITSCKNGIPGLAAIYSISEKDLLLSLSVASCQEMNQNIRTALADRCVRALKTSNKITRKALIRTIIELNCSHRFTDDFVLDLIKSDDKTLQMFGYLAAAQHPRRSILNEMIKKLPSSNANFVCLAACKNSDFASLILNQIPFISDLEFCAKVLALSFDHVNTRQLARNLAINPRYKDASEESINLLCEVFRLNKSIWAK